jgi:hypothetical protein
MSYNQKGIWILATPLTTEYQPVTACMACNGFMAEPPADASVTICSDPSNPLTEKILQSGGWFGITANFAGAGNSRWSPSEIMFYAKVSTGTGNLLVTYIK